MTPAAALVVGTLSLVAVLLAAVLAYRFARDGALDQAGGTFLLGVLAQLGTLLARSRPDPAATVEAPAAVTATPLEDDPEQPA